MVALKEKYLAACQEAKCTPVEPLAAALGAANAERPRLLLKLNGNDPSLFKDRIVDSQAGAIAEALAGNVVKSLDLSYNHLTDACAPAIAQIISENPNLRSLNLNSNDFTAAGVSHIVKALVSPEHGLQTLKLANNSIGNAGAQHLCEMLRVSKSIKVLDLGNTSMNEAGIIMIATTIHEHNDSLEVLDLERPLFKFPQSDAINHLARMVATHKQVGGQSVGVCCC